MGLGSKSRGLELTNLVHFAEYLWTAPELMRLPCIPDQGTQKGDVYSFAIVVQEIVSRQGVFYLGNRCSDKTPKGKVFCQLSK